MATSSETNRDHWLGLASRTSRRVNLGWWLDQMAAPLVVAATAGACGLLLARRKMPETPVWWYLVGITAGLGLLAFVTWLIARRKFETRDQSLVRIEATMHLRNALSAAEAGVAPWPPPPVAVNTGVRWNWPRLLVPILGTLLLLAGSLLFPLTAEPLTKHVTDEPQAWKQIEADLQALDNDKVVDEPYLEEMKKRLEELRAQKEDDWFSHSSLEATDSLKKSHASETARMERDLGRAEKAMNDLQKNAAGGQADQARLANEFDQALQGLKNGAMKPNPELLKQLENFDPGNLGKLSPEQMKQLQEGMKQAAEAMKNIQKGQNPGQGEGQGQGQDWADQLLGDGGEKGEGQGSGQGNQPGDGQGQGEGEGEGEGQDENGEGGGNGGVTRGPGHSEKLFGKERDKLKTGKPDAFEAKDLSKALPGDLLQLQDGEHEVDKSASRASAGGDTGATGQGGDRVWKESLDPGEQRAMKKFFSDTK